MNIILRPGGGDRAKALPRPKVEVNSEGSNVIVVKLTFPDNENIQVINEFGLDPTKAQELQISVRLFVRLADPNLSRAIILHLSGLDL